MKYFSVGQMLRHATFLLALMEEKHNSQPVRCQTCQVLQRWGIKLWIKGRNYWKSGKKNSSWISRSCPAWVARALIVRGNLYSKTTWVKQKSTYRIISSHLANIDLIEKWVTYQGYMERQRQFLDEMGPDTLVTHLDSWSLTGLLGLGDASLRVISGSYISLRQACRPGHCVLILKPGLLQVAYTQFCYVLLFCRTPLRAHPWLQ